MPSHDFEPKSDAPKAIVEPIDTTLRIDFPPANNSVESNYFQQQFQNSAQESQQMSAKGIVGGLELTDYSKLHPDTLQGTATDLERNDCKPDNSTERLTQNDGSVPRNPDEKRNPAPQDWPPYDSGDRPPKPQKPYNESEWTKQMKEQLDRISNPDKNNKANRTAIPPNIYY